MCVCVCVCVCVSVCVCVCVCVHVCVCVVCVRVYMYASLIVLGRWTLNKTGVQHRPSHLHTARLTLVLTVTDSKIATLLYSQCTEPEGE